MSGEEYIQRTAMEAVNFLENLDVPEGCICSYGYRHATSELLYGLEPGCPVHDPKPTFLDRLLLEKGLERQANWTYARDRGERPPDAERVLMGASREMLSDYSKSKAELANIEQSVRGHLGQEGER